jgi:hypothetical protein
MLEGGRAGWGAGLVDNSQSNLPLLTFHSVVQCYAYKQHHARVVKEGTAKHLPSVRCSLARLKEGAVKNHVS